MFHKFMEINKYRYFSKWHLQPLFKVSIAFSFPLEKRNLICFLIQENIVFSTFNVCCVLILKVFFICLWISYVWFYNIRFNFFSNILCVIHFTDLYLNFRCQATFIFLIGEKSARWNKIFFLTDKYFYQIFLLTKVDSFYLDLPLFYEFIFPNIFHPRFL